MRQILSIVPDYLMGAGQWLGVGHGKQFERKIVFVINSWRRSQIPAAASQRRVKGSIQWH